MKGKISREGLARGEAFSNDDDVLELGGVEGADG